MAVRRIFLRFVARCLTRLGFPGIWCLARGLAFFLWRCLPGRREESVRRIAEHLHVSAQEARCIAEKSFTHSAMAFLELVLVPRFGGLTDPRLRPEGDCGVFRRLLSEERPLVAVLAHLGSWELLASFADQVGPRPLVTVVRAHKNPAVNALLHDLRGSKGMEVLDHRDVSVSVLDRLRDRGLACFLVDHNCRLREAVFLPFLGKTAAVNRGPALLAVRARAVVFPIFLLRNEDVTYTMRVGEILDTANLTGSLRERVVRTAEFYTGAVEKEIRAHPEQWFWMHRRWKTRSPQEKDGDAAKRSL